MTSGRLEARSIKLPVRGCNTAQLGHFSSAACTPAARVHIHPNVPSDRKKKHQKTMATDPSHPQTADIVVLGAGIIGLSTAFHLSRYAHARITVLDSSPALFACASGRAGGFLAKDWFAAASAPLGELSFQLHRELADAHDGRARWGYTSTTSLNLLRPRKRGRSASTGGEGRISPGADWLRAGTSRVDAAASDGGSGSGAQSRLIAPEWLRVGDNEVRVSSKEETTAQVDPQQLCEFLLEQVRQRGVTVRYPATALRLGRTTAGELETLVFADGEGEERTLPCSHVLISAGPWSGRLFQTLFPTCDYWLPISSKAGHSIIIRSPYHQPGRSDDSGDDGCHAVFPRIAGQAWHPELFSRVDGGIYIAGLNSTTIPLPDIATDVKEQRDSIDELLSFAGDLVRQQDGEGGVTVVKTGLCHRPVTPAGQPMLARVSDDISGIKTRQDGGGGVFVCAGHGPWGISLSLGSGKVMAEMMMGEATFVLGSVYAAGNPVRSHQWPAGCSDGAASMLPYVGAGWELASDSLWSAEACCAAVARAERPASVESGIGVLWPVLFAFVFTCEAMREAAWARLTSVRTCLRFLLRRGAGFQEADLNGLSRGAMSRSSWSIGAGEEVPGAIVQCRDVVAKLSSCFGSLACLLSLHPIRHGDIPSLHHHHASHLPSTHNVPLKRRESTMSSSRNHASPMDWQWDKEGGPSDPLSPLAPQNIQRQLARQTAYPPRKRTANITPAFRYERHFGDIDITPVKDRPFSLAAPTSKPLFFTPLQNPLDGAAAASFKTPRDVASPSVASENEDSPAVRVPGMDSEMVTSPEPKKLAAKDTATEPATTEKPRGGLFATFGFSPAKKPARSEPFKPPKFSDKAARKVTRRRQRKGSTGAGDFWTTTADSYDEASDDEDGPFSLTNQLKNGKPAAGPVPTWAETHRDVPQILSQYLQLLVNILVATLAAYVVYLVAITIQRDVHQKEQEYITEAQLQVEDCQSKWIANRCNPELRVPAMETQCMAWRMCADSDPYSLGRSKVSAETFAEIINGFVEPISYKSMAFCFILLFGCLFVSNFAFGFFRAKVGGHPAPVLAAAAPRFVEYGGAAGVVHSFPAAAVFATPARVRGRSRSRSPTKRGRGTPFFTAVKGKKKGAEEDSQGEEEGSPTVRKRIGW
ncbi:hypothetical protein Dda_1423 [Drechslerella dactyloides]|uniref:Brl1/Brr6 domain-containing protein n=1 Tax=Drechslerella dactyloides TaxID=74499 RepID=A0AAD6J2E7_DREDA|nr:hypothetical protein Dda_1423 [Drechslerella dactyloides]